MSRALQRGVWDSHFVLFFILLYHNDAGMEAMH
jgi:hypothetical protein